MRRPLKVRVGSTNRVKVDAAKRAFVEVFRRVQIKGLEVPAKVSAQPFEEETIDGAVARARSAIGDADYGVGIEAGLFWDEGAKDYLDVQYCAVADKRGVVTIGHGPGFAYPKAVIEAVKRGKTVGEAMESFTKVKNIGRGIGAIGWLTQGVMDRTRLTEVAVLMALVPRVRRDLYFGSRTE
jgi:inosine/xanthosine triphosphatase